jgi:hypothetical protein
LASVSLPEEKSSSAYSSLKKRVFGGLEMLRSKQFAEFCFFSKEALF